MVSIPLPKKMSLEQVAELIKNANNEGNNVRLTMRNGCEFVLEIGGVYEVRKGEVG